MCFAYEQYLSISNGCLYRCSYYGTEEKELVIPEGVTEIASDAFRRTHFSKIVFPASLKKIGLRAFMDCTELTSVQIPETVEEIGMQAFFGCDGLAGENGMIIVNGILFGTVWKEFAPPGVVTIDVPEGVESISGYAFMRYLHMRETVIRLPKSLKKLEMFALWNIISLKEITIPEGVVSIGKNCFRSCQTLRRVVLPESLQSIGDHAFDDCRLEELFAPGTPLSQIEGTEMKQLAFKAFMKDSSRYVNPNVAASYRNYLIAQKKRILPEILKDDRVDLLRIFAEEKKITADHIDEEYLEPASEAHAAQCIAYLLELKNKLTAGKRTKKERDPLADDPFSQANMKKLWAFEKTADGTWELTDYKGSAAEIVVPERIGDLPVTVLGAYLFSPKKPRRRKAACDALMKAAGVIIPESVVEIKEHAFDGSPVFEIVLPRNLKRVGDRAFSCCCNLTEDFINAFAALDHPEVGKDIFWLCRRFPEPDRFLIVGKTLYSCSKARGEIRIPDGVERIAPGAFGILAANTVVCLPDSVTEIGENAFSTSFLAEIRFTVRASSGSCAQRYAKEHGIPFTADA